ncbi:hypothetical protein [Brevundimonas sp. A19_0]|uniref:hypothetical protein n=1 Tax=Brevundimonas sp. A19_0 TaxID=2821087 RepID=UPI001AD976B0|nr:hypothetical protein [Brevundimonas sp. A19_0]MBO9502045.1 hypothetical protein [Brevundimonas sp. A19_0]
MRKLAAAIGVGLLALAPGASAQVFGYSHGTFTAWMGRLEWEPDCRRLEPQSYERNSGYAFDLALQAWGRCVDEQGAADLRVAARAIEDGKKQAAEDLVNRLARGY